MSDSGLARKFHGLVDPVLGAERAAELIGACRTVVDAMDVRELANLTRP